MESKGGNLSEGDMYPLSASLALTSSEAREVTAASRTISARFVDRLSGWLVDAKSDCTRLGILTHLRSGVGNVRGKGTSSAMSASSIGEFSRGPQVRIVDGVCGRLIDAKREVMH